MSEYLITFIILGSFVLEIALISCVFPQFYLKDKGIRIIALKTNLLYSFYTKVFIKFPLSTSHTSFEYFWLLPSEIHFRAL